MSKKGDMLIQTPGLSFIGDIQDIMIRINAFKAEVIIYEHRGGADIFSCTKILPILAWIPRKFALLKFCAFALKMLPHLKMFAPNFCPPPPNPPGAINNAYFLKNYVYA